MKNTFGSALTVTIFGESHGDAVGATLDGLAPGIPVDREAINRELDKRRPRGRISTGRVEADEYEIISGVYRGYTTGTPLTLIIPNTNKKSGDYDSLRTVPRPSHADYTAECKYHGFEDPRGGGHFSGRITSALVAVGAIVKGALEARGIRIGTHIHTLFGVKDREFGDLGADIECLDGKYFPVLDSDKEAEMQRVITEAAERGDSVGGVLESAVIGMPAGVGEPWFDTLEGVLAHAIFSIPAIKGIEFGRGFGFSEIYGSEANDPFAVSGGRIVTKTNNNGGINGGISNGMPIVIRSAVKPTPSIFREQESVDISKMENTTLKIEGRHDPAIIHRARAAVDAAIAITLYDMLSVRFGTDYFGKVTGESK